MDIVTFSFLFKQHLVTFKTDNSSGRAARVCDNPSSSIIFKRGQRKDSTWTYKQSKCDFNGVLKRMQTSTSCNVSVGRSSDFVKPRKIHEMATH